MIEQAPVKGGEGHLLFCARGGLEKDSGCMSSGDLAVGWIKSSGGHSCRTRNGSSLRRKGLGEVRVGVIAPTRGSNLSPRSSPSEEAASTQRSSIPLTCSSGILTPARASLPVWEWG